jgi:hypothetical protein
MLQHAKIGGEGEETVTIGSQNEWVTTLPLSAAAAAAKADLATDEQRNEISRVALGQILRENPNNS